MINHSRLKIRHWADGQYSTLMNNYNEFYEGVLFNKDAIIFGGTNTVAEEATSYVGP